MSKTLHSFSTLLVVCFIIMSSLAVRAFHFADDNLRQDEVYTIFFAQTMTPLEIAQFLAQDSTHPLGWRLLAMGWIDVVGISNVAVRQLSVLASVLALAFTYRLLADLFGRRAGLAGALVLGFWPFAQFYFSELRPYPVLIACVAAATFFLVRWLRNPNFKYALFYMAAGGLGVHTHYYMIPVVMTHAVLFVILMRFNVRLYLRGFALFALVAFALSSWMFFVLITPTDADRQQGLNYAYPSSPLGLYFLSLYLFYSLGFNVIFFTLAVFAVILKSPPGCSGFGRQFRFGSRWCKLLILLFPIVMLVVVFALNFIFPTLTPRNMNIILVPLSAVIALAVVSIPQHWLGNGLLLLLVGFGVAEAARRESNLPLTDFKRAIAPIYQPGNPVIISVEAQGSSGANAIAVYIYLTTMMSPAVAPDDILLVTAFDGPLLSAATLGTLIQKVSRYGTSTPELVRLSRQVEGAEQAFLIHIDTNDGREAVGIGDLLFGYFGQVDEMPVQNAESLPLIEFQVYGLKHYSDAALSRAGTG